MGLPQAIKGKLVFLAAKRLQFPADLVVQVEWVSHDCERDVMLVH